MKRYFIITGLIMLSLIGHSQYVDDALRFSQINWQGTGRSIATGSSFAALGADFLTASTNPGGLGVYRTYDLSVTGEVFARKVNSEYNNSPSSASKSRFDLSNFGYTMTKEIGRGGKGWLYYQISFGMNRLANYNGRTDIQGPNSNLSDPLDLPTSRMDVYYEETLDMLDAGYGLDEIHEYDPFYLAPAWETYLLDTIRGLDGNLSLVSPVPYQTQLYQNQTIETKGSNNEYLAAFSANFNDVLYIGATLGLPYIRYFKESVYTETDVNDTDPNFNSWSVTENLRTRGWGVNLKVGIITRPVDWLRLGVAIHTPTYYWNMRDDWYTNTYSDIVPLSTGSQFVGNYESIEGSFKYKFTTPMRAIGSLGFVINKIGFISAEYEYVNYSTSKFKAGSGDFDSENTQIKDVYTATHNLRFGTEWRIAKISLRGGYAMYGNPYKDDLNDGSRTNITAGIGYRWDKFSLDLAYVHSTTNSSYYMYNYENPEFDIYIQPNAVENKIIDQHFVLGFRYFFN